MSLASDIRDDVKAIFKGAWTIRDGKKIPDIDDLKLTNDAVTFQAVVLYADLADSTNLVAEYAPQFAAEVYKSYLKSACRIITSNGGEITAFDGDRVMAVFFDEGKNTSAAKAALQINWAAQLVNEELAAYYTNTSYTVKQSVGLDSGSLFVAKTGIRGSNDLVWVGRSANYAAKLCALRDGYNSSFMTRDVFASVLNEALYCDGKLMWTEKWWPEFNITVYASNWWWEP